VVRGTLVVAGVALRYTACAAGTVHALWLAHADRVHVRVPRGLARSRKRLSELAELVVRGEAARIAEAMALVSRQRRERDAGVQARLGPHAFLLRGCPVRLEAGVHAAARTPIVEHRPERLTVILPPDGRESAEEVAEAWLRRQAGYDLADRLAARSAEMGLRHGLVRVRDQATRWGSCASTTNLAFNWRLVMAPPQVLDYVVVHELAHLVEMNHGPAFWAVVARHCPEWRWSRRWLRSNHELLRVPLLAGRAAVASTVD
jgi:predicted metal-dependent hydrolase